MANNTVKALFANPKHPPGQNVAEALGRSIKVVRSNPITHDAFDGDDTLTVFSVPANTFIYDIILEVVGAFGSGPSFKIGDGDDDDRFMDNTAFAGNTTGYKRITQDGQPGSQGYVYDTADTIDITQAGTPTAGTANLWLFYLPNLTEWALDS